ncbi:MAG: (2Fe-2S)-binding protein, partial [Merismopedia sp. SIO2A8]|nr:(2Fe-2S)-binding protein [Merismopedia sp. SIO2A8]
VNSLQDIEALVGRRAEQNMLHPITGQVLVEADKLITRSILKQLEDTPSFKVGEAFSNTSKA